MEDLDFELTTVTLTKVGDKLDDVPSLEFLLNSNLKLSRYGAAVDQVFLVFTVTSPDSEGQQEPVINFDREEKLLEIILPLGYREVIKGSRDQAMRHLTGAMLFAFDEVAGDPPVEGFEFSRLAGDLKKLIGE